MISQCIKGTELDWDLIFLVSCASYILVYKYRVYTIVASKACILYNRFCTRMFSLIILRGPYTGKIQLLLLVNCKLWAIFNFMCCGTIYSLNVTNICICFFKFSLCTLINDICSFLKQFYFLLCITLETQV